MKTGDPNNLPTVPPRPLSTADLPACLALAGDREWPYEDHKWDFLLRLGQGFGIPDPSGGLAACAVLTRSGDLATISMVLVAARFARRGLGTRVMRHAIGAAGDATVTLYATPFGKPLYEKLGFHASTEVQANVGVLRAERSGLTRVASAADLSAILELDRAVFGVDRSNVLSGLFDFADHVRVIERDNRIVGYASAWRPGTGLDNRIIGPLIAEGDHDAKALIADLARDVDGPVRVDVDDSRGELAVWVAERGLAPMFRAAAMTLGGRPLPGDRRRLVLPFMQALG
ncbi:GNAT family N-acetyltransferase [Actinokineospora iranica]|uniref:Acetyltransferase (GNAT) domain-containing protein n=1 Tax=Actinokineospora iranica TaxID=1271860 RepID=A0A1G6QNG9_9PSEU|nr:GNAT family N-acetyltransferase [Actinokineospora iranica]SDC93296.1 Acetyltransferase (GNAT) domain-containing protein [Actinokineospora iranica]